MAKKWWEIPAISLLFLFLAVVSTYPLISYLDTGIPYSAFGGAKVWNRSGDQIQLMYWFWLVKENFLGHVPFDSNPFEFNPFGTSGLNTIPLAFLYMIFSPFGDVAAYNCAILSSYVLTGTFMYLLVKLYSGSRTGALLAAVIFTFAPSRIRGLTAGHGYGMLFFCYPFILYYLEKGIRSARIGYGIVSSIGLIGLAMLEPHLIYYMCVFLGVFIPVRLLSLFPVYRQNREGSVFDSSAWPLSRSFVLLWGAGAAVTVYAQALFFCRDNTLFFTEAFWWVLVLYPLGLILVSLCFSAVYQRLSTLDFRQCIAVEAGSFLPFFLCLPLVLPACYGQPVNTGVLVVACLTAVVVLKAWLLRFHLFSMMKTLGKGLWKRRKAIFPILPLIFAMAAIVYWMSASKVEQVAATIAGGGRTLDDVGLFSARLSDLFLSISNVYVGVVPAVLGGGLLLVLLITSVSEKQRFRFVDDAAFLRLFYIVIAFCCLILSLGLAFGKISLYALFFHYFPFFNYPRVSDRIITLALFALAIVSGFVVREIQVRRQGGIGLAAVTLFLFASIGFQLKDYNVFQPMGINILDRGQDIYSYVKKNIGEGVLLEVPLWPGDSHQSSLYQHYIMLDRVPRLNGSSPMVLKQYIDTVYEPLSGMNQGRLEREQFELLHRLGVKFITVHDNRDIFLEKVSPFAPLATVRRLQNSPYLEQIHTDNVMHFKSFDTENPHLFLFQLKSMEEVEGTTEQAWYEMPYFYDVNRRLHKQIGRIVHDSSLGKKVFEANEGQDTSGFLVYGPYDVYSPGEYRCYFSIHVEGEYGTVVARIEVAEVAENGDVQVLTQQEVKAVNENGVYTKEHLDYSITKNTKLEFRVFYYGRGQVRLEQIAVNRSGSDEPLNFIKAEMMVGNTGLLESEEEAATGNVIEAVVGKSKKGDMVYGPNRIYSKGIYRARFLLRMKDDDRLKDDEVVAVASVTEGQNLRVFSRRQVRAEELSEDDFTGIELDFELLRDEYLSFHVQFVEKASLQLDGIQVIAH
jgi:hypothetical protein